ncbi:MAG: adenosine deaminase [bacterium]|nr:adenosine deaminase [bacterium]
MKKIEHTLLSIEDIRALPKVELHLHLDCCLSYDVVSQLAPSITMEKYREDFVAPAKCKDLADFLKTTHVGIGLMQREKGLRLVTEDLFKQLARDNVIYAEIRFAPLQHLAQGLSPHRVVEIVEETVAQSIAGTGVEARVVLCTLRHYNEDQSLATARLAEDFRGTTVAGFDIAADEAGFPIAEHITAFEYAAKQGIYCTAHAGEARGPESVWETLDFFKPARIGHGVRSIEDSRLIDTLIEKSIHLEVCPTCNVQIDVFDTNENHPIDRLYQAGVSVGINTDTRTITDISLSDEYRMLQEVFGWGKEHFFKCNSNALAAAFLADAGKRELALKLSKSYT